MLTFLTHSRCEALSTFFRGQLCTSLTGQGGRWITRGSFVYCQGDPSQSVYFLRAGLIKTSILCEDGKEQILRLYKPGEIFGELCFCTSMRREQAVALEDSMIVELAFAQLIGHLQGNSQALTSFLSTISHHLEEAYEQIRLLSTEKVMGRLIQTLLRLANEMGEPLDQWVRLRHHLTQDDLARMIGARREVTSTLLNQLRTAACIDYSSRGQFLLDPLALEQYQHPGGPNTEKGLSLPLPTGSRSC